MKKLTCIASIGGLAFLAFFETTQGNLRQTAPPTTYPMIVRFDPATPAPQAGVYQSIQNVLDGFNQLPNNRVAFFSGYNQNAGYYLAGWSATITSAHPNGNGYLATLLVMPAMSSPVGADTVIGDLAYFEQYQVNNDDSFVYVGSLDPNGQAGLVSNQLNGY